MILRSSRKRSKKGGKEYDGTEQEIIPEELCAGIIVFVFLDTIMLVFPFGLYIAVVYWHWYSFWSKQIDKFLLYNTNLT